MEFVAQFYHEQILGNGYFLHVLPRHASSREIACIKGRQYINEVEVTQGDQCKYGAGAPHGPHRGSPVKKPTGFMSNAQELL